LPLSEFPSAISEFVNYRLDQKCDDIGSENITEVRPKRFFGLF
jgi:hypothetical protein